MTRFQPGGVLQNGGSRGDDRRTVANEEVAVNPPIFGLSTTPVMDIKSELRQQLERDLLALVYRATR